MTQECDKKVAGKLTHAVLGLVELNGAGAFNAAEFERHNVPFYGYYLHASDPTPIFDQLVEEHR